MSAETRPGFRLKPGSAFAFRLARRAAAGVVLLTSAILVLTKAETENGFSGGLPGHLAESSEFPDTRLHWRNGEQIKGELHAADSKVLQWNSALFDDALRLRRTALTRIDFAGESLDTPGESFRFVFADGSHLTGSLNALDDDLLHLSGGDRGEIAVKREQVVAIERLTGEGLVIAGPASWLRGERMDHGRGIERKPPFLSPGGEVVFLEFYGGMRQTIELPDRCLLRLRMRFEGQPAFSLRLATQSQWVCLETWDDELVLNSVDDFVSSGSPVLDERGRLDVQLAWDRTSETCTLFDRDGEILAILPVNESPLLLPPPAAIITPGIPWTAAILDHVWGQEAFVSALRLGGREPGITLTNRCAGFAIERYAVTEWSGQAPRLPEDGQIQIDTSEEILTSAQPVACCEDEILTVRTESGDHAIPLHSLRALRWPRSIDQGRHSDWTHLWYANGNLLRGTFKEFSSDKARFQTTFSSEPVEASLENGHALVFPAPHEEENLDSKPLENLDVLSAQGETLRGKIVHSGNMLPTFRPTGSGYAPLPVPTEDLELKPHLPPDGDYTRAPAFLHSQSNETLPVTIQDVDDHAIRFHWDAASQESVVTELLHAVQLSPASSTRGSKGFDDEHWQFLGRGGPLPERTDRGILLQPDSAIGHPGLLQGDDFSFRFAKPEQLSCLRIRLFCQGTLSNSDSLNFLIGHQGSHVYGGLESERHGQFESSRSLTLESPEEPVEVGIRFAGDQAILSLNEEEIARTEIRHKRGRNSGAGLVMETTSMWGSRSGPATIFDFSIRHSPGVVSSPPFSEDAKQEALLLPRLRREVPPRHVLIGHNGDLLRGEISGQDASGEDLRFRVGLEQFRVPLKRIAAVIWVAEADKTAERNVRKNRRSPPPIRQTKRSGLNLKPTRLHLHHRPRRLRAVGMPIREVRAARNVSNPSRHNGSISPMEAGFDCKSRSGNPTRSGATTPFWETAPFP